MSTDCTDHDHNGTFSAEGKSTCNVYMNMYTQPIMHLFFSCKFWNNIIIRVQNYQLLYCMLIYTNATIVCIVNSNKDSGSCQLGKVNMFRHENYLKIICIKNLGFCHVCVEINIRWIFVSYALPMCNFSIKNNSQDIVSFGTVKIYIISL
jgi:hypothetical protein